MQNNCLSLNGFALTFSSEQFTAYVQQMPADGNLQPLRDQLRGIWFLHRNGDKIYGLPIVPEPSASFGTPITLNCLDHLQLLSARLVNILPHIFHKHAV